MPKDKPEEVKARKEAIAKATKTAAEVPLKVARISAACFDMIEAMATDGNPNSVTDAGVGALCVRAAVRGAALNVKVNLMGFEDKAFVSETIAEIEQLEKEADKREETILKRVESKLKP